MQKISFLIATKNRGHLIKDTLDSLLKQDIEDWEAIIIDDHGTDKTQGIVSKYNDSRLRYYSLNDAHGHGAGCARNFGVLYARAEIIAILDSDDIVYPRRAGVTYESFQEDTELDVFYSSFDIWQEKTGEIYERLEPPVYDFSIEKMKELNYIPHCTLAIKKNVLLSNPYNQFFKLAEDYEITSRLACAGKKFKFSKERLMKYRASDENISRGDDKKEIITLYNNLVKMIRGWEPFDEKVLDRLEEIEKAKF